MSSVHGAWCGVDGGALKEVVKEAMCADGVGAEICQGWLDRCVHACVRACACADVCMITGTGAGGSCREDWESWQQGRADKQESQDVMRAYACVHMAAASPVLWRTVLLGRRLSATHHVMNVHACFEWERVLSCSPPTWDLG